MTDNKKYELTNDVIEFFYGLKLYRIRALRDFAGVKKGELGGYVEWETNLSHEGNSWIGEKAQVYGNARVQENAKVTDEAIVYENAVISGNAQVRGNARVWGDAKIYGTSLVCGYANITGLATIKDKSAVLGYTVVRDSATIGECTYLDGYTSVSGNAEISVVGLQDSFRANALISGDAHILHPNDVLVISSIGSRNDRLTAYRSKMPEGIEVTTGCFQGTLGEFKRQVRDKHGSSVYAQQYRMAISFIKQFFKINMAEFKG